MPRQNASHPANLVIGNTNKHQRLLLKMLAAQRTYYQAACTFVLVRLYTSVVLLQNIITQAGQASLHELSQGRLRTTVLHSTPFSGPTLTRASPGQTGSPLPLALSLTSSKKRSRSHTHAFLLTEHENARGIPQRLIYGHGTPDAI